jgi:hypothetical protein
MRTTRPGALLAARRRRGANSAEGGGAAPQKEERHQKRSGTRRRAASDEERRGIGGGPLRRVRSLRRRPARIRSAAPHRIHWRRRRPRVASAVPGACGGDPRAAADGSGEPPASGYVRGAGAGRHRNVSPHRHGGGESADWAGV